MGIGDSEEVAALRDRVESLEGMFEDLCTVILGWKVKKKPKQKALLELGATEPKSDFAELRNELVATFERVTGRKYVFDGAKDAAAVKKLLNLRADLRAQPLQDRWEECLRKKNFPGTQSLAQFVTRINSFGEKANVVPLPTVVGDPYAAS